MLAGATLVIAFGAVCVRTGSPWPWLLVVHEDGLRTLLGTILYFEHATRELPLDILLGVTIGGCVFFAFPPDVAASTKRDARRVTVLAAMLVVVVAIIVAGAAIVAGPPSVLENLLQNHTRLGAALLWGSHWRYHLLERLALMLVVIGIAGLLRFFVDGGRDATGRAGMIMAAGTVGIYLLLTVVFAHGPLSLLQPFRDPQYLGHQARELFTHALVTVPLGWGACMLMLCKARTSAPSATLSWPSSVSAIVMVAILTGALGVLMGGFVGIAALRSDAASYGQTKDLAMLIFPHFFEHSFTYVVVPLVAALSYESVTAFRAPSGSRTSLGRSSEL